MNQKAFLINIFIVIITKEVLALKSTDFCFTTQKQCAKRQENSTIIECSKEICTGHTNFKCSTNYCAKDEILCKNFLRLNHSLMAMMLPKLAIGGLYEKRIKMFKTLVQSIKQCSIPVYKWSASDVCASGTNCRIKQRLPVRYNYLNIYNPVPCPCRGEFSFVCGVNYCTTDKIACDGLLVRNESLIDEIKSNLKACDNDNIVLKQA